MFKGIWVYGGQHELMVLAGPTPQGSVGGCVYGHVCINRAVPICMRLPRERMYIYMGKYAVCVYP